jgi:hypothetical protein
MKENVVLLCWCSEWKDEYLLFFDDNGPMKNLLKIKKLDGYRAYTTPTLTVPGNKVQITDIFSLQTCKSLSKIQLRDWITMIRLGHNKTLDRMVNWKLTDKHVDIDTLKRDLKLYKSLYLKDQKEYRRTPYGDETYKWAEIDHKGSEDVPMKQSGIGIEIPSLQLLGLHNAPFTTGTPRGQNYKFDNRPPRGEGKKGNRGDGQRGLARQGGGKGEGSNKNRGGYVSYQDNRNLTIHNSKANARKFNNGKWG